MARDAASVVGLNHAAMAVFEGPRVLFLDGFSRESKISAQFIMIGRLASPTVSALSPVGMGMQHS